MPSGTCGICGTDRQWLHRHHLKPRCEGGTDADGTILICANCHEDVHDGPMGGKSLQHRRVSPAANAKRSEAMRRRWAEDSEFQRRMAARDGAHTPEVNQRRSDTARRTFGQWTDEQRKDHAERISATKRAQNAALHERIRKVASDNPEWSRGRIAQEVPCNRGTVVKVLRSVS